MDHFFFHKLLQIQIPHRQFFISSSKVQGYRYRYNWHDNPSKIEFIFFQRLKKDYKTDISWVEFYFILFFFDEKQPNMKFKKPISSVLTLSHQNKILLLKINSRKKKTFFYKWKNTSAHFHLIIHIYKEYWDVLSSFQLFILLVFPNVLQNTRKI